MDSSIVCLSNSTNDTFDHHKIDNTRIDIVKRSIGVTSFLFVLPFVLFHFKKFPIGATGAVLIGATLTVLTQTINQHEVYAVLGGSENIRTICLLLGMMILAQYFERELLAERLLRKILRTDGRFSIYLLAMTLFDFFLAAVFTNDVACVALTPLILTNWSTKRKGSKSKQYELPVLLLGIATSANIGSAATIFGNPQMALIASKTSEKLFDKSRLDMRNCVFYLWLPAVLCFIANYGFLLIYARLLKWLGEKKNLEQAEASSKKNENGDESKANTRNQAVVHETALANSVSYHNGADYNLVQPSLSFHQPIDPNSVHLHNNRPVVTRSISIGSSLIAAQIDHQRIDKWTPSGSIVFQSILCTGVLLIVVLFLISNEKIHFDMGLVPMGVSIIAILFDSLINKRSPMGVFQRVDWSVLLMFFGMFVWLYGLNKTNAPRYIWDRLDVGEIMQSNRRSIRSYLIFYAFIMICSNIFSNVPLTIIVLELLTPCVDQLELVLYLAWLSTIAGNLTLFGSIANLIVAQKAFSSIGYRLGFFEYLRFGFLTTLVLSVFGMAVIYGLLQ